MIDITHKKSTLRSATAKGRVLCSPESIRRIRAADLPKGDLFNVARAAGLLAAKSTANLIPHCHPVLIEGLDIEFITDDSGIEITVTGRSTGKTGIEMEALTACSIAALTLYDLLKPIDKGLEISSIRLMEKRGGKSDTNRDLFANLTAAILVCSDSASEGGRVDGSGAAIREYMEQYGVAIIDFRIVPDSIPLIQSAIREWVDRDAAFIFTSGGTGFGPRDVTIEALRPLLEREAPGISEAIRSYGMQRTQRAMLSRAVSGSIRKTTVVTLPGSERGVREGLEAILPALFHSRGMLEGEGHGAK
jgi:molybdenum cofactor biosynthesis protein MoaC